MWEILNHHRGSSLDFHIAMILFFEKWLDLTNTNHRGGWWGAVSRRIWNESIVSKCPDNFDGSHLKPISMIYFLCIKFQKEFFNFYTQIENENQTKTITFKTTSIKIIVLINFLHMIHFLTGLMHNWVKMLYKSWEINWQTI